MSRVAGVDLSLTSTGVAILDTVTRVVTLHTITSRPTKPKDATSSVHDRVTRLRGIWTALCLNGPLDDELDLAVIEAPSYGSSNGGKHERSGLWWAVATAMYETVGAVAEVSPSQRMKYATGSGAADKDKVLAAVIRRYVDVEVSGNDTADALVLAAMGARYLGEPYEPDLPLTHLAAMDKVDWPKTNAKTGALL